MTKEELEKQAEEKLPQAELDYCRGFMIPCEPSELPYIELVRFRTGFERGYLAGAEPREKRIAELEAEVKEWKDKADLWCKTANLKDHNIMINKELEKENTELKEKFLTVKKDDIRKSKLNECKTYEEKVEYLRQVTNYALFNDDISVMLWCFCQRGEIDKDQLTKAKEIITELYHSIPSSLADYCKDAMEKAENFLKESEVEK